MTRDRAPIDVQRGVRAGVTLVLLAYAPLRVATAQTDAIRPQIVQPQIVRPQIVQPQIVQAQAAPKVSNEELKGFWNKGDARSWNTAVSPNSSGGVVYHDYPLSVDQVREARQRQEEASKEAAKAPNPQQNAANIESLPPAATNTAPLTREQILAKYGSPDQPQMIKAQKDSPPAMQGLFESLNSGDKDLAWQYAVALAKRQAEMQKTVSKATDYQMLAMEALGIRKAPEASAETDALDPVRAEVQEFMQRTQEEARMQGAVIDPNLGEESEFVEKPSSAAKKQQVIPVDPEGKAKVLIFFDEKQPDAPQIATAIRPLKERYKEERKVSFIGLTKRTYTVSGLKSKGAEISFPFPLLSGEALALELRIQRYPTVVFLAPTTKQTYRIEGIPSVEQIEKTVQVIRGAN